MIKLRKEIQTGLLIALAVLAVLFTGLLGKELLAKEVKSEEVIAYEYTTKGEVNYTVSAKNNELYTTSELPEGDNYITKFINGIQVNFVQQFQGNGVAKIDGEYSVTAQVRGYETKDQQKQIIWKRDFTILPKEIFSSEGERFEINRNVGVDFHGYNNFAQGIIEMSEVRVPVEVVVALDGYMNVSSADGISKVPIYNGIVIPLNSGYFTIAKEGVGEQPGKISTTVEVAVAKNTKQMMVYGVGILLCLVGLFGVKRFTIAEQGDYRKGQMNRIMKNHGSRMVAVERINTTGFIEQYVVTDIEDLVKIADELERPLMYEYKENLVDIDLFYVLDGKNAYIYQVKYAKPKSYTNGDEASF